MATYATQEELFHKRIQEEELFQNMRDGNVEGMFHNTYKLFVEYDEDIMKRNKRIARLVALNFSKYLRQKHLCEVAVKGQGNYHN